MEAGPPATPRHMYELLPLLPSGPGGVHRCTLRRDRQTHHKDIIPARAIICNAFERTMPLGTGSHFPQNPPPLQAFSQATL